MVCHCAPCNKLLKLKKKKEYDIKLGSSSLVVSITKDLVRVLK